MCKPLLLNGQPIEAHVIQSRTFGLARELVEGCGGLVYWDDQAEQAHGVPALAPTWTSLAPLAAANEGWRADYQMHQARLDHIWSSALRHQVDPRLMVAILIHEGTGSFNTNPSNAAQYNGHGPDADWIADTKRAISHIAGKLARYHQAVGAGFREAATGLGLEGTAIQFCGWPGPIWQHLPIWGCYAQHADWWQGVTRFYEQVGGNVGLLTNYWVWGPVAVDPIRLRCEAVTTRPDM